MGRQGLRQRLLALSFGARTRGRPHVSVQDIRKGGGDHTTDRPYPTISTTIRPPPLSGIFGVPDSGSRIAREPRALLRQASPNDDAIVRLVGASAGGLGPMAAQWRTARNEQRVDDCAPLYEPRIARACHRHLCRQAARRGILTSLGPLRRPALLHHDPGHHQQLWRRKAMIIASFASVRAVCRGSFGPVFRSSTVSRFRHSRPSLD